MNDPEKIKSDSNFIFFTYSGIDEKRYFKIYYKNKINI